MEQQHTAVVHPAHDFFQGLFGIGLLILHPVVIGKRPEYAGQPQPLVIFQRPLRKFTAGKPELSRGRNAQRADQIVPAGYLFLVGIEIGKRGHIGVIERMIAYGMPFRGHALHQLTVFFYKVAV